MSKFAKAELLKYGWTEGKGLGKNENGITEALKPKLKFDTAGIGHKESNFQWWDSVYDKALKNIILDNNSEEVSIKVVRNDAFDISTSASTIEFKRKSQSLRHGKFLKTSTLHDGKISQDNSLEENKSETIDEPNIFQISDEDLFKACGGRTAHKGARHGLTLSGKLARVAAQEQLLTGSLLSKSCDDSLQFIKKKKKKKQKAGGKHISTVPENGYMSADDENPIIPLPPKTEEKRKLSKDTRRKVKRKINDLTDQLTKSCLIEECSLKNNEKTFEDQTELEMNECEKIVQKTIKTFGKKKSKRKRIEETIDVKESDMQSEDDILMKSCKKLKKNEFDQQEWNSARKDEERRKFVKDEETVGNCVLTGKRYKKWLKKCEKREKKERKNFEKLGLLVVNLDVNS